MQDSQARLGISMESTAFCQPFHNSSNVLNCMRVSTWEKDREEAPSPRFFMGNGNVVSTFFLVLLVAVKFLSCSCDLYRIRFTLAYPQSAYLDVFRIRWGRSRSEGSIFMKVLENFAS